MRRKLPAKLRITRPLPVTRPAAALLGIIAILFQAILFAWHHHAHSFPLPELSAVGSVVVAGGDPVLPSADAARRWYRSDEYQAVLKIRLSASHGRVFSVEGTEISSAVPVAGLDGGAGH